MSDIIFNKFKAGLLQGSYNLTTLPVWVALVNNSYTPNIDTHLYGTSPRVYEITGSGYAAGGLALSGPNVLQDNTGDRGILYGTNIAWDNATFIARGAVLYGSSGAGMASDPLLCYFDFTTDKSVTAGTFAIQWSANGIINCT